MVLQVKFSCEIIHCGRFGMVLDYKRAEETEK